MELSLNNKKILLELDSFGNIYFNIDNIIYSINVDENNIELNKYISLDYFNKIKNYEIKKIKDDILYSSLKEKLFYEITNSHNYDNYDDHIVFHSKINFKIHTRELCLPLYSISIYNLNKILIFYTYLVGFIPIFHLEIFPDEIIIKYDNMEKSYSLKKL